MGKRPARWQKHLERTLKKCIQQGKTIDEIAQLLSKTYAAVHNKMVRMKLIGLYDKTQAGKQKPKREWTNGEDEMLKQDFNKKTTEALAEELGRTVHEVRKRLECLGWRRRYHWKKEDENELRQVKRLTDNEIRRIGEQIKERDNYCLSEAAVRRKWIRLRQAQQNAGEEEEEEEFRTH